MYQKVIIVGNLGSDPQMRMTGNNVPVCSFSVATNERWRNSSGEQQEKTTWWRVTAWRGLAETCNQYLSKGRQVMIEGKITVDPETGAPRIWTGDDGVARSSLELEAATVKFLGGAGPSNNGAGGNQQEFDSSLQDEVPF